jgi:MFS family permease
MVGAGIFGALTPLVIADIMRGTGRYNLAQGAIATVQGIGASLSGLAAGVIVDHCGYSAAFLAAGAAAMVALAVFALGMPEPAEPETAWVLAPAGCRRATAESGYLLKRLVGRLAHEVRRYYPADQDRRVRRWPAGKVLAHRGLNERLSAVYRLLRPSTARAVHDCRCEGARNERLWLKKPAGKNRLGIRGNVGLRDYSTLGIYAV